MTYDEALARAQSILAGKSRSYVTDAQDFASFVTTAHGELAKSRAMLEHIEWQGREDYVGDGGYDCCPQCRGIAPHHLDEGVTSAVPDVQDAIRRGIPVGHFPACELDALIRGA